MKNTMDWATRERLWRLRAMLTLVLDEMSAISAHNTTVGEDWDQLSDCMDNLGVARDEMGEIVAQPERSILMDRPR